MALGSSIGTEARWLRIDIVAITLRGDGSIRRSTMMVTEPNGGLDTVGYGPQAIHRHEGRWLRIDIVAITLRGDGSIRRSTGSWSRPRLIRTRWVMARGPSIDTEVDGYALTS